MTLRSLTKYAFVPLVPCAAVLLIENRADLAHWLHAAGAWGWSLYTVWMRSPKDEARDSESLKKIIFIRKALGDIMAKHPHGEIQVSKDVPVTAPQPTAKSMPNDTLGWGPEGGPPKFPDTNSDPK